MSPKHQVRPSLYLGMGVQQPCTIMQAQKCNIMSITQNADGVGAFAVPPQFAGHLSVEEPTVNKALSMSSAPKHDGGCC